MVRPDERHFIALAYGVTFTFRGRLHDGGAPATGLYDFAFTVFDAAIPAGARR